MKDVPATTSESGRKERYGAFETGDGDVVVYDRKEPTAWIQSTFAVEVGSK